MFTTVCFLSFVNGWFISGWLFFGHGFPVWWGILLFSIILGVFWFLLLLFLAGMAALSMGHVRSVPPGETFPGKEVRYDYYLEEMKTK